MFDFSRLVEFLKLPLPATTVGYLEIGRLAADGNIATRRVLSFVPTPGVTYFANLDGAALEPELSFGLHPAVVRSPRDGGLIPGIKFEMTPRAQSSAGLFARMVIGYAPFFVTFGWRGQPGQAMRAVSAAVTATAIAAAIPDTDKRVILEVNAGPSTAPPGAPALDLVDVGYYIDVGPHERVAAPSASLVDSPLYTELPTLGPTQVGDAGRATSGLLAEFTGVPSQAGANSSVVVDFASTASATQVDYRGSATLPAARLRLLDVDIGDNGEYTRGELRLGDVPTAVAAALTTSTGPAAPSTTIELGSSPPSVPMSVPLGSIGVNLAHKELRWKALDQTLVVEQLLETRVWEPDSHITDARLVVGLRGARHLKLVSRTPSDGSSELDVNLSLGADPLARAGDRSARIVIAQDLPIEVRGIRYDPKASRTAVRVGMLPDELTVSLRTAEGVFVLNKTGGALKRLHALHLDPPALRAETYGSEDRRIDVLVPDLPEGDVVVDVSGSVNLTLPAPTYAEVGLRSLRGLSAEGGIAPKHVMVAAQFPPGIALTLDSDLAPRNLEIVEALSTGGRIVSSGTTADATGALIRLADGRCGRIVDVDGSTVITDIPEEPHPVGTAQWAQSDSVRLTTSHPDALAPALRGINGRVAIAFDRVDHLVAVRATPQVVLKKETPTSSDMPSTLGARVYGLEGLALLLGVTNLPLRAEMAFAPTAGRANKSLRLEQREIAADDIRPWIYELPTELRIARVPERADVIIAPSPLRVDLRFSARTGPGYLGMQPLQETPWHSFSAHEAERALIEGWFDGLPTRGRLTTLPSVYMPGREIPHGWPAGHPIERPGEAGGLVLEVDGELRLTNFKQVGFDRDGRTSPTPVWWSGTLIRLLKLVPVLPAAATTPMPFFAAVRWTDRFPVTDQPSVLSMEAAGLKLDIDVDSNTAEVDHVVHGWRDLAQPGSWDLNAEIQAKDFRGHFGVGTSPTEEGELAEAVDEGDWRVHAIAVLGGGDVWFGTDHGGSILFIPADRIFE